MATKALLLLALGGCVADGEAELEQSLAADPCSSSPLDAQFDSIQSARSPTLYGTSTCRYFITQYDPVSHPPGPFVRQQVFHVQWSDPWPRTKQQCLGSTLDKPITMRVKVMSGVDTDVDEVLGEGTIRSEWDSAAQKCVLWNLLIARNSLDSTTWLVQPYAPDRPATIGDPSSPGSFAISSLSGLRGVRFAVSARTSVGTTQPVTVSIQGSF
jgi:hypothetical protein